MIDKINIVIALLGLVFGGLGVAAFSGRGLTNIKRDILDNKRSIDKLELCKKDQDDRLKELEKFMNDINHSIRSVVKGQETMCYRFEEYQNRNMKTHDAIASLMEQQVKSSTALVEQMMKQYNRLDGKVDAIKAG